MAWNDTDLSRAAALAGLVIAVCTFGGGAYTYGLLADQEEASISITADFEPTTTPGASGQNIVAEADCGKIVFTNEGTNAAQVSVDGPNGYERSRAVQPGKSRTLGGLSQGDYVLTAATGNSPKKWTVNQKPETTVTVDCTDESSTDGQSITAAGESGTTTTTAATATESKPTTAETTSTATETATTTKSPRRTTTTDAPATITTNETTATATETTTATPTSTTTETTTATPTSTTTTENET